MGKEIKPLLPEEQEERAYTVSAMLYPILDTRMMPLAALLYETLGMERLLLIQATLLELAALVETRIRVQESRRD
ncbi:MAG: hypothetical protein V8Q43_02800 [Christensenellaceae bacterium]